MALISLDGDDWQLRGCLGREWEWHVDKPWDASGWLPARVPGSVLDDLVRAGEVASPYHERASRLAEWVPERSWVYRRRVSVRGGRAAIDFGGIDHAATVFVDGVEVGRHEGAFTPFSVDVPPGEHTLAVVVHAAPESEPQVGATSRVRVHKSRMGYGWDFCPRMVHQGIWRPVTLRVDELSHPLVPRVTCDGRIGAVRSEGPLELLEGGEVVAAGEGELRIDRPRLWWPNGLGEPFLYTLRSGREEVRIGFRSVELAPDYSLVVNGERATIRGWNWVPLDALYGVPRPAKLAHLLDLARRAQVNLLRVWGGGLIETTEFYDTCDRLGLLVWQEFSQSSSGMESVPSDDPEFVRLLVDDARTIVPLRRRHPSLAIWCGGNELDGDDSTPVLAALRDVVRELDPDRAWLATSPLGEDVHGPWEHQGLRAHYELYETKPCRLHSEFGVEGMTNRRALAALVSPEHRWPADRTNPVYEHLGAWWNNAPLVQECFGGRIGDVETLRRASQWLQYEGLRYAVEARLRRGIGVIPWQLNESFPNAWCTAAVDHRGDAKPAYYGVARAYSTASSASFATCAWGGERVARARVEGAARFVGVDGLVVAERADAGELEAELDAFATDLFFLDLGSNRYLMSRTANLAPLLDLAPAEVEVQLDGILRLRHVGGPAAVGIVLEDARAFDAPGWILFSDNVIDLLPGESREIEVFGPAETILVEGWNVKCST